MKYFLILFLALCLIPFSVYADYLADGQAAYNRKDYRTAIKLLEPLAEQGNEAALKWLHMAADQGNKEAQGALGKMYFSGEGVNKDYAMALKWYRMSAQQGEALSQFSLGKMYFNGEGVKKDSVQAYMWLILAAGDKSGKFAEEKDKMAESLTPEQMREAKHLASEWKPIQ